MTIEDRKDAARKAAFERRKAAYEAAGPDQSDLLCEVVANYAGRPLSGYSRMRTEIDPTPAMAQAARSGPVGMPVIEAKATPLKFKLWTPEARMEPGTFGASVPAGADWMVPEVLIVPLLAFDRLGGRLGYGGGFYDRTLQMLRLSGPVVAIGYAFAAQEDEGLPLEPTDEPLDMIVTEREVIDLPGRPG